MLALGRVKPGSTIYIPFESFAGATGASITITGLATSDIKIYKDGGTTERASTNGYTLLDTDGIDFDGITGIHGFSIDLADNTTSGFYTCGSRYFIVVSTITVDSQTVSFLAATFHIGYEGAILDTTLASLSSQTSFTLTAGSADNDAYNGCVAVVHDIASGVQVAMGVISDYVGSTKTVTLAADPGIFTMASGDNISIFPRVNVHTFTDAALTAAAIAANAITSSELADGAITAAKFGAGAIDATAIADNAIDAGAIATGAITAAKFAAGAIDAAAIAPNAIGASEIADGAITAAKIATDAIDADAIAADAVAEIQSGLSTLTAAGVRTAVGLATANLDTQLAVLPRILGLSQDNWVMDDTTYDADDNLTEATIYVYSSKANAVTHDGSTGLLYTYTVQGTITAGNLTLAKQLRES